MPTAELQKTVRLWRRDPESFARGMLGIDSLWQRQVEILEALRTHRRVAVPSCHESGKMLPLDTPLPSPTGWTTMGAIAVGDLLLDETGEPSRIIATSPVHERDCFRVVFSDGTEIIASDDHRWAVLDARTAGRGWDDTVVRTTAFLAEHGADRWSIPPWCDNPEGVRFTAIEPVGPRMGKCVMVDSPRSVYLAGSGSIPTHNTFVASVAAVHHLLSYQPSKVITTAPTQRQVKDLLWSEIRARHAGMIRHLGGEPGLGSPTLTHWSIPGESDWFATGFATSPDKAQESAVRMSGYHSPHLLVILDEAGGIAREVWAAVDSLLTSGSAKVLAIGNPSSGTEFERICRSPDWRVLRISAFDCPNLQPGAEQRPWGVTQTWVDEMRRRWGEGSVVYQTKVLGLFPESSVDTLISIADVERALARKPPQECKERAAIGVDVARFGTDETVLYVLRGGAIVAVESFVGQDTMKTAGRTIALAKAHGLWTDSAHRISVDDTGVGGGVVDRLREQGWKVQAINFGSRPQRSSNEGKFTNRRMEMWWNLRDWLREEAALADLDPDVQDLLRADLCAPKYEQKSDGRIALERKAKIRERVGRSPDHGDALALAVAARAGLRRVPMGVPRERRRGKYDHLFGSMTSRELMRGLRETYGGGPGWS